MLRVVLVLSISYETEVVVVANDPLLLIILQKLRHDVDDVLDVLQIVVLGICDEVIDLNLGFCPFMAFHSLLFFEAHRWVLLGGGGVIALRFNTGSESVIVCTRARYTFL